MINLFLIPVWKRPEITRVCLRNLQRHNQQILCVVSRVEDAELCYELGVHYIWYPNEQLGAKWNYGLLASKRMDWDYIVTLGSDDIVKSSLFEFYASRPEDVVMMDKIEFMEIPSGKASVISNARVGAGRRISRRVIEACGYQLWTPEKNKSLDLDSNSTMNRHRFITTPIITSPHIVGLKSDVNIWSFDHVTRRAGKYISQSQALSGLLPETKADILTLLQPSTV